jgi:predicted transcriptional regulator
MAAVIMLKALDTLIAHKMINLSDALSGTDKRVATVLIDHFNRKTGQCDPSINTIAELLGVSPRTVVRSIARLVKSGLFRKIKHGGKFHRNSYEPVWSVFRQLDDAWSDRRKARRAAFRSPNVSLCKGQPCHSVDDQDVTQTYLKNHFKETLRAAPPKSQQSALREPKKDGLADFEGWSGAKATLKRLRISIGDAACKHWFCDVEFVAYRNGIIFLLAPDAFYRDELSNRYQPKLLACFSPDYPDVFDIKLGIRGDHDRDQAS